ncbi:MAG: prepilin-type N-terminal cleavage/methylation domain-containing protein [Desulfocapsa sp.]|uniref:Prepilin-type N-terminal cleavage/methylation domain-containing protein n=1 Tax=Desulfotalea psychrophila TaxID=84980 RepID=A0ABS3ASU0_9BACT|nr:prepilin-type N-terminal cleavage/methylation domain-containing protein [Desulfocapsa sp.]MBN4060056.1 prepilin-type N-terminal cleavage/methylation domain-containing protein [Desulfotalea psychrophila]MBN4068181.1 prepilin-type N-terminal cleavage/methylation domain-containing protein [Desulfotalea psychrophila]
MKQNKSNKSFVTVAESLGFTLVELMIAMFISGITVSAIYSAYIVQQRVYTSQEQVAEMQQNLRAGMDILRRELRMAGFDGAQNVTHPSCDVGAVNSVAPGILTLAPGQIDFSMDLNMDGDCADINENLTYSLYVTASGVPALGRRDNNNALGRQAVAENITALEFQYLDSSGTVIPPSGTAGDVREVQVSLLARAGRIDRSYTNTVVYTPYSGVPWDLNGAAVGNAANDNFRRRLLLTTIRGRNLGI